jgi:hypothetical protein
MGFDSEAAATEVIRVRKSLAEKREARFLLREQEEPATADVWSMPGERSYVEAAPSLDIDIHFTLPERPPVPEPLQEPEPAFEPEPVADRRSVSTELDINIDEAEEAPFADVLPNPIPYSVARWGLTTHLLHSPRCLRNWNSRHVTWHTK